MFINLSSDRIFFVHKQQRTVLPFGDLEKNLPAFLHDTLPSILQENSGESLVVLHGPGSFTNIRIGTLALNTYTMLHNYYIEFLNINKIQWYWSLYIQKKLPRFCVMYIGQKKNYRIIDLEKCDTFMKNHSDFDRQKKDIISQLLQACVEKVLLEDFLQTVKEGENVFFDEVVGEAREAIHTMCDRGSIQPYFYAFQDTDINLVTTHLQAHKQLQKDVFLEANYMIEANVS